MYSNFKQQAIEYVKQAVQEDHAGNYAKAFPLYMNALEYFKTHLKYEKDPKILEAITGKFNEYLQRAEEIRIVLDDRVAGPVVTSGLQSAIVGEKPDVKWSDVVGVESAKQALQEAVILPIKFSQFFTGKRQPWRSFLLYGPPGTGKSYLAKAVAAESGSTFFSVSSSDLVSKWMGESDEQVSNIFQRARESAPSIIFIDEIDSLCGQLNESGASRSIKTEILVQMQGVGANDDKVLVLAATNTPYSLDQAIRKRFDKCIYIPLPDLRARQHIFKVHLGDTPSNLNESDFESLARKTEGFSGSDIAVCVKDALYEPLRKTQDAMFFVKKKDDFLLSGVPHIKKVRGSNPIIRMLCCIYPTKSMNYSPKEEKNKDLWVPCGPEQPGAVKTTMQELAAKGLAERISIPPVTRTDFDKVLTRQKPTISKSELEVHERFTKEFGEEG